MVSFRLISKTEKEIKYEYFPENDKNALPGIIVIDREKEDIFVLQQAEKDFSRIIPVSELNALRDSVDEMRQEDGMPPLTEEDWPKATKDDIYYFYASNAISKIADAYNEGEILEDGMSIWY